MSVLAFIIRQALIIPGPDYSHGLYVLLIFIQMVKELGITPIEMEKSIIDMAYSLIDHGFVKKTKEYNEPKNDENGC
jgi:hypothetical protein